MYSVNIKGFSVYIFIVILNYALRCVLGLKMLSVNLQTGYFIPGHY